MIPNITETISEFSLIKDYLFQALQRERLQSARAHILGETIKVIVVSEMFNRRLSDKSTCSLVHNWLNQASRYYPYCPYDVQAVQNLLWWATCRIPTFSGGEVMPNGDLEFVNSCMWATVNWTDILVLIPGPRADWHVT